MAASIFASSPLSSAKNHPASSEAHFAIAAAAGAAAARSGLAAMSSSNSGAASEKAKWVQQAVCYVSAERCIY